jgi:spore maturation protein CgeB
VISDLWNGIDTFFEPNKEILTAASANEVVRHLRQHTDANSRKLGFAMHCRALRDHTYQMRALEVDRLIRDLHWPPVSSIASQPLSEAASPGSTIAAARKPIP